MMVKAHAANQQPVAILRAEPISRDIYIALFAGKPAKVTVQEPFNGVRFGVEPSKKTSPPASEIYKVDARDVAGENIIVSNAPERVGVPFRSPYAKRVINFVSVALNSQNAAIAGHPAEDTSRQVALNLEQRPYIQEFLGSNEPRGSQPVETAYKTLRGANRVMNLISLLARREQQEKLGDA